MDSHDVLVVFLLGRFYLRIERAVLFSQLFLWGTRQQRKGGILCN